MPIAGRRLIGLGAAARFRPDVGLVAEHAHTLEGASLIQRILSVEFCRWALGAGSFAQECPLSCTGRNLAYKKAFTKRWAALPLLAIWWVETTSISCAWSKRPVENGLESGCRSRILPVLLLARRSAAEDAACC